MDGTYIPSNVPVLYASNRNKILIDANFYVFVCVRSVWSGAGNISAWETVDPREKLHQFSMNPTCKISGLDSHIDSARWESNTGQQGKVSALTIQTLRQSAELSNKTVSFYTTFVD